MQKNLSFSPQGAVLTFACPRWYQWRRVEPSRSWSWQQKAVGIFLGVIVLIFMLLLMRVAVLAVLDRAMM